MTSSVRAAILVGCLLAAAAGAEAQPQPFGSGDVFLSTTGGLLYGYRFNATSQTWEIVTVLITDSPDFPATGSAFDRDGNVYVATFTSGQVSGKVVRFARDWDPTTPSRPIETFGFAPKSVALDAQGNIFVGHARKNAPALQCAAASSVVTRGDIITKLDAAGLCVGAFQVEVEGLAQAGDAGESREGADWIDLAADQRTIFYTSQGRRILRYDTQSETQLPDFAVLADEDVRCDPAVLPPAGVRCGQAFALRLLPDGGLLVADNVNVKRLDANGHPVGDPYDLPGHDNWFSLNLDPDGRSFWSGDAETGQVHKFDIASGAVLASIDTGLVQGLLLGVSVFEEPTQASNPLGSISGVAYHDVNGNGVRDSGEPGIPGVQIDLAGLGSTSTDPQGAYSFDALEPASYVVGAPSTAAGKGLGTASTIPVVLAPAENRKDQNFGYRAGAIAGFTFVDANRNGLRDAGEAPLAGVAITAGAAVATTDADGWYRFEGLDAGSYTIVAPASADSIPLATANPLVIDVPAGQPVADVNFGYVPAAPALTLVKTATPLRYSRVGETIIYTYVLENTGAVALDGPFVVVDDKLGEIECGGLSSLAPGATVSCTRDYVVRPQDMGNVAELPAGVPATVYTGAWLQGRMSTQDTTIRGAGPIVPNGLYPGWCIQDHVPRDLHDEPARLYGTLGVLPADAAGLPWRQINHVLNHKIRGPGKSDLEFFKDVQTAIWLLLGEKRPTFGVSGDALAMVTAASASPDFLPGPGDVVAVIVYSDGMGTAPGTVQESIIEVRPPQSITNIATASAMFAGQPVTSNEARATVSQQIAATPPTVHHPGDRSCRDRRHRHPKGDDCPWPRPVRHPRENECQDPRHHHPSVIRRPAGFTGRAGRQRSTTK